MGMGWTLIWTLSGPAEALPLNGSQTAQRPDPGNSITPMAGAWFIMASPLGKCKMPFPGQFRAAGSLRRNI